MTKWDERWLMLAEVYAAFSEDDSTKVGCVIVSHENDQLSSGWNGLPRMVENTPERNERPEKYKWFEHAERNAIYNAARVGTALHGAILYLNFAPCPCTDCTRAVIQSGIKRIVVPKENPFPGKGEQWEEDLRIAAEMLADTDVELIHV